MPTYYVRCGEEREIVEAMDRRQAALAALKLILARPTGPLAPFLYVSRRYFTAWAGAFSVKALAEKHGLTLPTEGRS